MNGTSLEIPYYDINEGIMISPEEFVTITYALAYIMVFISLVGVVTNTINIRAFVMMGLEDGITICLAGLAVSDLGTALFGCILSAGSILSVVEETYEIKALPISPRGIFSVFSVNVCLIFLQVSSLITTFMAVARCACVAMPFQFKNYFTKNKSILAMIVFVVIAISSYIPLLTQMEARTGFDPVVNKTRIVLWLSSKRSDIKDVVSFIHLVMIIFASTFIVIVCVVIMGVYLKESVKFRHNSSAAAACEEGSEGKGEPKLSGKELQVLRQVIVICSIYTICNIPALLIGIFRLVDANFDVGKRLAFFYYIASDVGFIFFFINSATTFLVYYEFNSKFRSICSSWRRDTKNDVNNK